MPDITDRKSVEENLRNRSQGLATLLEVSKCLAATLDLQNVLQASVDGVTKLVGLDTAAVYLLEGEMLHLWATTPPLPPQFPDELRNAPLADHPHIREAITSGEAVHVADMTTADLSPAERAVTEQRNLRTVLFVPLIVDAKAIGTFIVGSVGKPSDIADSEIDSSITLANLAALTIRNAQLYEDGQRYADQLEQSLTACKLAEQERDKLEAQLLQSQKMEAIGRLAGGVAHDFNNMLSVILGYADLALGKVDSSQPLHNALVQIRNASRRSANLTRQLLAFARKQIAAPVVLDLNEVIGEMLNILRRLIGEDIDLVWVPGDGLGLVKMDPAQVDQIMANLCVNARDAIFGVGKVTIETSNAIFDETWCVEHPGCIPGAYVMITVSDNGVGMDQGTLANIFEPYFTTKKEGEGTGLGLSTVYGIVKQNKGFITVSSKPGQGTIFNINLSRHEAEGGARQLKTAEQVAEGGNETILLVEDEIMILDLTRSMLESLGYKVLTAPGPSDALLLAKKHSGTIDLLITDVVMPEMNGLELAEQLKTIIADLKILYMSGYTADVIAHHGLLHTGVMLLEKPFSLTALAIKVRETIKAKL